MDEKRNYQVQLYYGFQETEDSIYHAFEATDPEGVPDDNVPERLAELLDTTIKQIDTSDCSDSYKDRIKQAIAYM